MDNLQFRDFLVGVRYLVCLGACILLMSAWQAMPTRAADQPQPAQQNGASPTAGIQKVQRLLKLLADRQPEQYGAVDPGRLDGVLGKETRIAIGNFRRIASVTEKAIPDNQLYTAVLAELARTAADGPAEPSTASEAAIAPAASIERDADRGRDAAAAADATAPSAATPAQVAPATAIAPAPASASARPDSAVAAESLRTTVPEILYFVQVASLRSIESAEREWERIKGENRAALQGEQTYLERIELENRGIFHRILIGPMPTREDAITLCGYLKQNDQTCVVTQRHSARLNKIDYRKLSGNQTGKAKPPLPWDIPQTTAKGDVEPKAAPIPPAPAPTGPMSDEAEQAMRPDAPAGGETAAATATPPRSPAAGPADPEAPFAEKPAVVPTPVRPATPPPVATAPASPGTASTTPTARTSELPAADSPTSEQPASDTAPRDATAAQAHPDEASKPDAAAAPNGGTPVPAAQSPAATARIGTRPGGGLHISAEALQVIAATTTTLLAFVLVGGFFLYRRIHRARQYPVVSVPAEPGGGVVEVSPLSELEDEKRGDIESLAQLEEAFDSPRLRESRRIRDTFLREVLDDDPDDPSEVDKRDAAIRVNSNLKMLLATDPEQYKSIFLSLIFLSKVGAALNRNDIALEELNGKFSREFLLLQSYFKIHILELDDRHRIRQELPGLFYCLQLSQLQRRQGKRRFSAA